MLVSYLIRLLSWANPTENLTRTKALLDLLNLMLEQLNVYLGLSDDKAETWTESKLRKKVFQGDVFQDSLKIVHKVIKSVLRHWTLWSGQ